ncbi:FAD-binding protein [Rubrobacter marinus]|uniref:D-lactate dehydrogenase (cytochrome) n=1 Tax=Rubrobacter marinus TaxID=2653852 RepID=A0A6G8Q050_9ACTN|nr:FAD-linked oxidase C-terminal domain-containing protein [Rubrobacter marinus]QIN79864.1 FAD-binding protein [Rubrobacter marinus]
MNLVSELGKILPKGRVSAGEDELKRHGGGFFTYHAPHLPDAVVFPRNREEVLEVLRFADERGVPVVPFGQGSSLEGHTVPVRGGISLDMNGMDEILEIRPDDFLARVQPGVTHGKLNAALAEHGLLFPVDPGWDAAIGGMAGTNASGTNAVRYGVMRDQVLGLEVALPGGTVMRTGGLAMKSSAGYGLTGLFVGSEGTLGVFTELILRLYPIPTRILAARAVFGGIEEAAGAAVAIIRSGMKIGRVELVDARTVEAVNAYKGTDYAVEPTLFLEFSGGEGGVEEDVAKAREIARSNGSLTFEFEEDEAAREKLWEARHEAGLAIQNLNPEKSPMSTDVCVPISELPGALGHARDAIASRGLDGAILGHVGDGNYHAVFPVDRDDEEDLRRAEEVNAEIVDYALARGGTSTGEHGIGSGKMRHLQREHGDSLAFMLGIKGLADPNGIMNPGKIFASAEGARELSGESY